MKDQELASTQSFRVLTMRRASPMQKEKINLIISNNWLTSTSTTDAVTAREFQQFTPRRARHVDVGGS
jgi:hypothetical protein